MHACRLHQDGLVPLLAYTVHLQVMLQLILHLDDSLVLKNLGVEELLLLKKLLLLLKDQGLGVVSVLLTGDGLLLGQLLFLFYLHIQQVSQLDTSIRI